LLFTRHSPQPSSPLHFANDIYIFRQSAIQDTSAIYLFAPLFAAMTSLLGKRKTPEPGRASHNEDLTVTPTGSPARKKLKITQSQKQAIIDNLQLESKIVLPTTPMEAMVPLDSVLLTQAVTERARKLRAQYALQAQDLRARIERRVNRIPLALRKATMGELLEKYGATTRSDEATQTFKKPALPPKTAKHAPITTISRDVEGSSVSAAAPTPVKGQARRPKRATYGLSFLLYINMLTGR
jgi:hypothetical protein